MSKTQRLLLLIAAAWLILAVVVSYMHHEDLEYAFEEGIELSKVPLIIVGILFVAALGVPDSAFPWSEEKKLERLARKDRRNFAKINKIADEADALKLQRALNSTAQIARSAYSVLDNVNSTIVRSKKHKDGFRNQSIETFVEGATDWIELEQRLQSLIFSYSIHFARLQLKPRSSTPPEGELFLKYRSHLAPIVEQLALKSDDLMKKNWELLSNSNEVVDNFEHRKASVLLAKADETRRLWETRDTKAWVDALLNPILISNLGYSTESRGRISKALIKIAGDHLRSQF